MDVAPTDGLAAPPTAEPEKQMPTVLCCMCSLPIPPNPTSMCVLCIRTQVDITEGIATNLTIHQCRGCKRYLRPPWVEAKLESRELMAVCLRKVGHSLLGNLGSFHGPVLSLPCPSWQIEQLRCLDYIMYAASSQLFEEHWYCGQHARPYKKGGKQSRNINIATPFICITVSPVLSCAVCSPQHTPTPPPPPPPPPNEQIQINGLKKVKLVDASWIWTEPHSRRLKLKLTVQKEVGNGAVLQQAMVVTFVERNQQCDDCAAAFTNNTWTAVVQVRQRVDHKRTFFYLEQLILKHNAHSQCTNIQVCSNYAPTYADLEGLQCTARGSAPWLTLSTLVKAFAVRIVVLS